MLSSLKAKYQQSKIVQIMSKKAVESPVNKILNDLLENPRLRHQNSVSKKAIFFSHRGFAK